MRILVISLLFLFCACQSPHEREIKDWRADRLAELKDPYGWPSVVGLFWLRNTLSYFGSSGTNDFMIANAPSSFGHIEKTDTSLIQKAFKNKDVYVDGVITHVAPLNTDMHPDGPTLSTFGSLQWYVLERGDRYYLRVKDTLSKTRQALHDIPYFPIDEAYRVEAKVIDKPNLSDTITYKNILDQEISSTVAAYLSFTLMGQEYSLAALDNDEETYFIMISDLTSGLTTYGGGRYLYPQKADKEGRVILDFNKLINPPCVFTAHATCPFPPKQNHLPIAMNVGEKELHLY